MSEPRERWQWFGTAAHLIVGSDCRFHMATVVGPWLISTVGEWLPSESSWDIYARSRGVTIEGQGDARRNDFMRKVGWVEIGAGRTYETMVFKAGEPCTAEDCNCGLPSPEDWGEIDYDGYNDRGAATRGHYAMCDKWALASLQDAALAAEKRPA